MPSCIFYYFYYYFLIYISKQKKERNKKHLCNLTVGQESYRQVDPESMINTSRLKTKKKKKKKKNILKIFCFKILKKKNILKMCWFIIYPNYKFFVVVYFWLNLWMYIVNLLL